MLAARVETLEVAHRKLEQQIKSSVSDVKLQFDSKVQEIRKQIN